MRHNPPRSKAGIVVRSAVSALCAGALTACLIDEPTRPTNLAVTKAVAPPSLGSILSVNTRLQLLAGDAAQQLRAAVQGRSERGGQDDMLRIEAAAPGFAGYYVDHNEQVVLLRKPSMPTSTDVLRQLVHSQYVSHPSSIVRAIMASAATARVVDAAYSLSELIAWERLVFENSVKIQGCTGTGVSGRINKLTVTLEQSTDESAAGGDSGAPLFARTSNCGIYCAIGLQSTAEGITNPPGGDGICTAGLACRVLFSRLSSISIGMGLGNLDPKTVP